MPNKELKKARIDKEMTQLEISKLAGMNVATYNRKENGLLEFKESEIRKIAEILEMRVERLFFLNQKLPKR